MSKMTLFQKHLSEVQTNNEKLQLFEDFPKIVKDTRFADEIYDSIRNKANFENSVTEQGVVVTVEDQTVTFSLGFVTAKIDLPFLFAIWLPMLYRSYLPKNEKYEKKAVLDQAIETLCEMLNYLDKFLRKTPLQALMESFNLVLAHKADFEGMSVEKTRAWMSRDFKIKFPAGRKPAPFEDSKKEKVIQTYSELMEILIPGFDKNNQSVTKYKAACDAVDSAGIPNDDGQTADQIWEKRSPKQAAIYLIAKKFETSERHIRRWVLEK